MDQTQICSLCIYQSYLLCVTHNYIYGVVYYCRGLQFENIYIYVLICIVCIVCTCMYEYICVHHIIERKKSRSGCSYTDR